MEKSKKETNSRKRTKIVLTLTGIFLVVLLGGLLFAGNYLVNFAIVRKEEANDVAPASIVTDENQAIMDENREKITKQKKKWLTDTVLEKVQITSEDGLALKGDIIHTQEESHKWLIAVHGYTGKRSDSQNIASFYGMQGYQILMPDMRSHGESEGKYIGMGWLDRKDLLKWIDYVITLDPEAQIILHGVSMGGATVMMVSGENLPPQVKGIVEDCGYTSVWDIFSDELRYLFGLPEFPILYVADLVAQVRAGYEFKEASALEQVKKSQVPMLFIHGTEDNFVRSDMAPILYEACPTEKSLLLIEGAGHGNAYLMDPEQYFKTVFTFLEEKCDMKL